MTKKDDIQILVVVVVVIINVCDLPLERIFKRESKKGKKEELSSNENVTDKQGGCCASWSLKH